MKEKTSPTNLPHRMYRFYKSRYERMECVVGVKRYEEKGIFWLVGLVEKVNEYDLVFKYLDGTIYIIPFDDIFRINWYSKQYFERRGIPDPKLKFEQQQKETVKRKYEEFYGDKK